jgi:hypothetical protein
MSDNIIVSPSIFHGKLNEYIIEAPGRMYIFEVTKLCGYSTFIFMYKDETMVDLYNRVSHHFGCKDIKWLYIDSYLHKNSNDSNENDSNDSNDDNKNNQTHNHNHKFNHKKIEQLIPVPISSLTTVREFVFNNTAKDPRNMDPIYALPFPVVYRVYLDDGHCHCGF